MDVICAEFTDDLAFINQLIAIQTTVWEEKIENHYLCFWDLNYNFNSNKKAFQKIQKALYY